MKITTTILAIMLSVTAFAQVGIQTETPKATLDVVGLPADASKFDGIIAPRITGAQLRGKSYTADQTGALIYVTAADTSPAGQTVDVTAVGYYYFNGTKWMPTTTTTNIYNTNGSLTGTRTVTLNGRSLSFLGLNQRAEFQDDGYLTLRGTSGDYRSMYRLITSDRNGNGSGNKFEVNLFADSDLQLQASSDVSSFSIGTSYTVNASPITFYTSAGSNTAGTEKLRITGTGNVGINNPSPTKTLDVVGNARITNMPASTSVQDMYVMGDINGNLLSRPQISSSEGSKIYKAKFRGRNVTPYTKPVLSIPELNLEFRFAVIGTDNRLQIRMINVPSATVTVATYGHWHGASHSHNIINFTFTTANYNTWQNVDVAWTNQWGYYYLIATNETRAGINPLDYVMNLYGMNGYGSALGVANEPYTLCAEVF